MPSLNCFPKIAAKRIRSVDTKTREFSPAWKICSELINLDYSRIEVAVGTKKQKKQEKQERQQNLKF
jgi:predicted phosphoadenosine phosphosulfate sulfurtransferase